MNRIYLFLILTLVSMPAFAAKQPIALGTDNRIRHVLYNPNEVYEIQATYGYQTTIEFASDEIVQVVTPGDSIAWQLVPVGSRLFIKPVEERPRTNLTVITSKRVYFFNLSTIPTNKLISDMTYLVRFEYPKTPGPTSTGFTKASEPSQYNFSYELKHDKKSGLVRAFDNGEFTYLQFKDLADLPAIFLIDEDSGETLVNYRIEGAYVVIERVGNQFAFRRGKIVGLLVNKNALPSSEPKKYQSSQEGRHEQS